jgi:hypothetical protein
VLDIVDETFLAVPPKVVAEAFADPTSWRRFWPDLELAVYDDRGAEGLRWTVAGPVSGTMEIWLEPVLDGTVLHYFLRADPAAPLRARKAQKLRRQRQLDAKRISLGLKLELEHGRPLGCPPETP